MSFTFSDDFWQASRYYGEDGQRDFVAAICAYAFDGIEPDESEPWYPTFLTIRDRVSMSAGQSARGKKGGRPRKDAAPKDDEPVQEHTVETALKPNGKTALKAVGETDSETASKTYRGEVRGDKGSRGEVSGGSKGGAAPQPPAPSRRFVVPTADEVEAYGKAYCRDKGIPPDSFSAEIFVDHYASKGWKVGRSPMKDWRAACRGSIREGWTLRGARASPSAPMTQWDIEHEEALKAFDEGAEVWGEGR